MAQLGYVECEKHEGETTLFYTLTNAGSKLDTKALAK